jgi:hypothetical protein
VVFKMSRRAAGLRGTRGVPALLDTAHTPRSVAGLVDTVQALCQPDRRVALVLGIAEDKAAADIVHALQHLPLASVKCVSCAIAGSAERSRDAEQLANLFHGEAQAAQPVFFDIDEIGDGRDRRRANASIAVDVVRAKGGATAVSRALDQIREEDMAANDGKGSGPTGQLLILVTGSTYVVADGIRHLPGEL